VCLVLERIFSPILPYKITIITIGKAKKTHVDTSHSGNCSGFSSIAQNAESGISTFAVNEKKTPVREDIMVGECLALRKRMRDDSCFGEIVLVGGMEVKKANSEDV
jgi:hypothetical protein